MSWFDLGAAFAGMAGSRRSPAGSILHGFDAGPGSEAGHSNDFWVNVRSGAPHDLYGPCTRDTGTLTYQWSALSGALVSSAPSSGHVTFSLPIGETLDFHHAFDGIVVILKTNSADYAADFSASGTWTGTPGPGLQEQGESAASGDGTIIVTLIGTFAAAFTTGDPITVTMNVASGVAAPVTGYLYVFGISTTRGRSIIEWQGSADSGNQAQAEGSPMPDLTTTMDLGSGRLITGFISGPADSSTLNFGGSIVWTHVSDSGGTAFVSAGDGVFNGVPRGTFSLGITDSAAENVFVAVQAIQDGRIWPGPV